MLQYFSNSLYSYDKAKVNILKCILPFFIILQHMSQFGFSELSRFSRIDELVMWLFLAMSGYGLVISYVNNDKYISGFLQRSILKLFIPYLLALCSFIIYRAIEGIDQIALFVEKGLYSFVPTSWFVWTLSYFYIFFYLIFRYLKIGIAKKIFLLCAVIFIYCWIAPHIGIELWRYNRCPGFCVGALFALVDFKFRNVMKYWMALSLLPIIYLCMLMSAYFQLPIPSAFFLVALFFVSMYLFRLPKILSESKVVLFVSSISFELFILQFIPIYIAVNDLQISSAYFAVLFVFTTDIIIATLAHQIVNKLNRKVSYTLMFCKSCSSENRSSQFPPN